MKWGQNSTDFIGCFEGQSQARCKNAVSAAQTSWWCVVLVDWGLGIGGHSFSEHMVLPAQALPGCFGNVKMSKTWPSSQKTQNLVEEISTAVRRR